MINREELVNRIAEKYNTTKGDTKLWFDAVIDVLAESVVEDNVKIRGFGNFELKVQAPRIGRDVIKNEPVQIPARYKLSFKPCDSLKEAVISKEI